jgi:hypothetical protein
MHFFRLATVLVVKSPRDTVRNRLDETLRENESKFRSLPSLDAQGSLVGLRFILDVFSAGRVLGNKHGRIIKTHSGLYGSTHSLFDLEPSGPDAPNLNDNFHPFFIDALIGCFHGASGFWHTVLGLLMHNIPALILLLILILAWKHELVGAVAFTFAGLLYAYFLVKGHRPAGWFILIGAPALLIGVLFFINWMRERNPFANESH